MRKLVRQAGKDPEMLAALRRAVFQTAAEGSQQGGLLSSFIKSNEKSLKILFENTQHLDDLKTLADLQRRVEAFSSVTGQVPEFNSLDENIKKVFGSGVQYLTTTFREAAVGRINPATGALALMIRLASGVEKQVYDRIFVKALEDKNFAKRITGIGNPEDGAKVAGELTKIGVPRSFFQSLVTAPGASRAAVLEANQELRDDSAPTRVDRSLPVVGTARQMLRNMPPAPPSRGMGAPNLRTPAYVPPARSQRSNVSLMYPTLFPNDPISSMLQQRAAMGNQGQ
jgi:hypothetical protein